MDRNGQGCAKGGGVEQALWTRARLGSCGPPLDLLTARFDKHVYAPHAHDEFTIGVCVGGSEVIDYRGGHIRTGPISLVVLGPGEMHTGGPGNTTDGYAYRARYAETQVRDGEDAHSGEAQCEPGDPPYAQPLRGGGRRVPGGALHARHSDRLHPDPRGLGAGDGRRGSGPPGPAGSMVDTADEPGGRPRGVPLRGFPRNVRAPQGRVMANGHPG
jgi:hypothetical protein